MNKYIRPYLSSGEPSKRRMNPSLSRQRSLKRNTLVPPSKQSQKSTLFVLNGIRRDTTRTKVHMQGKR